MPTTCCMHTEIVCCYSPQSPSRSEYVGICLRRFKCTLSTDDRQTSHCSRVQPSHHCTL